MKTSEKDLDGLRKRHPAEKIVFCSGGFDFTHAGHALFFEDCKKHGDVLVVGIASDAVRVKERGHSRAPVFNQHVRLHMVDSLKPVDYAFLLTEIAGPEEHPSTPLVEIFNSLRPDVWVVNEDASDIPHREKIARDNNIELVILPRTCPLEFENISTSGIIKKIKESQ